MPDKPTERVRCYCNKCDKQFSYSRPVATKGAKRSSCEECASPQAKYQRAKKYDYKTKATGPTAEQSLATARQVKADFNLNSLQNCSVDAFIRKVNRILSGKKTLAAIKVDKSKGFIAGFWQG